MKNYLNYLQHVLGIKSLILPVQESASVDVATPVQKTKKLVVLDSGNWSKEEGVLLEKMLMALRKEVANIETISFSGNLLEHLPTVLEAQEILLFDENVQSALETHGISNSILIASPKKLIANPELKRDAWEAMKKAAHRVK